MATHSIFHLLFVLSLCLAAKCAAVDEDELESVLTVLRVRGHTLFSNAIATSDLLYEIVNSNSTFTFFAPTDSFIFALDMTSTASDYSSALRCHVIPIRLSRNQLRRFPSGYVLRTLFRNHRIRIDNRRSDRMTSSAGYITAIDGVRVVAPGLFYSRHIAVHGLGGTLDCIGSDREINPDNPIKNSDPCEFSGDNDVVEANLRISSAVDRYRRSTTPAKSSDGQNIFEPLNISAQPPVSEPSTFDGCRSRNSPEVQYFPQSYREWAEIPSASTFPLRTEPPMPEFSENDDPNDFLPLREREELLMMGLDLEEEEREREIIRSIAPEDLTLIMESENG